MAATLKGPLYSSLLNGRRFQVRLSFQAPWDYGCCAPAWMRLAGPSSFLPAVSHIGGCAGGGPWLVQEQLTTRSMRWLRRRNGVQRAEELWSSAPQRRASDGAGASGEATTADHFRQTLDSTRRQSALSWSYAQPQASRACGAVKSGALRRSRCFSPSTIALPKASTRST